MDQIVKGRQPQREIQAVVAAIIALMVAFSPLARTPTWEFAASFLGSKLALEAGADLLGAAIVAGLVGAAALVGPLSSESWGLQALLELAAHWALPMIWAVAMWEIAPNLRASLMRAAFAIAGGVGLGLLMRVSEHRRRAAHHQPSDLFEDLATYVALLALLTMLHAAHLRSAISATSAAVLGSLSALGLLYPFGATPWRTLGASLATGMLLGQFMWALNYCTATSATAGGLLLLSFYAMIGILRHALRDRLRPRHVIEYLLVCGLGLTLILMRARLWGP